MKPALLHFSADGINCDVKSQLMIACGVSSSVGFPGRL